MKNEIEITLQCPKCNSSVSLKIDKKAHEVDGMKISWSIPVDTDRIQELLINQIQELTLHMRGGEIIHVKCHNK